MWSRAAVLGAGPLVQAGLPHGARSGGVAGGPPVDLGLRRRGGLVGSLLRQQDFGAGRGRAGPFPGRLARVRSIADPVRRGPSNATISPTRARTSSYACGPTMLLATRVRSIADPCASRPLNRATSLTRARALQLRLRADDAAGHAGPQHR